MAEIEHFCSDEKDEHHPKFPSIKDIKMRFRSQEIQKNDGETVSMTVGEAMQLV